MSIRESSRIVDVHDTRGLSASNARLTRNLRRGCSINGIPDCETLSVSSFHENWTRGTWKEVLCGPSGLVRKTQLGVTRTDSRAQTRQSDEKSPTTFKLRMIPVPDYSLTTKY